MRLVTLSLPLLAAALALPALSPADKPAPKRVLWTTSKVKGSPEPPPPYRLEVAFPKVKFFEPIEMAAAPGTDRLFVATRPGKIYSFDPKTQQADLLLDTKRMVYGLTFHPDFAKNGYLYVTIIVDPSKEQPKGTRVSRFVAAGSPPKADPATEKVIFEWPNGGHNGGCLRFGPDGYLYIATGDGSGVADQLETGQDVGDLLASILRIDVDKPDPGEPGGVSPRRNYSVPADNPFVKLKGARPEVYAYGLRQAWKFSFDRKSGDLWAGDVGQDLWEMVYKIEKGGNYGWSVTEGAHPFRPDRKKGPTPILKPVVEHDHTEFRSITGGYVYHGSRLPELAGAYVYGDFDTGQVWALRHNGKKVTQHRQLHDSPLRIVAFGQDHAGEVYAVDWVGGQMHRLVTAPPAPATNDFPRQLSETGLFTSTKDLTPAPGLIAYSVNSPLWSDGAAKDRYLAIPGDGRIEIDGVQYPGGPGAPKGWRFPHGTVAVKTFSLGGRRLETRLLHFEQLGGNEEVGDQYWRGYTYVWNDDQTDATLLDAKGADRVYTVDGRERKWHFPSRVECTLCHTMPAKFVLGLNTHQLNRDHNGENQLVAWEKMGLFKKPLPAPPDRLPRLAEPDDPKASVPDRARSYLQANCAHCHMQWGGGNAEFQLLFTLSLDDMKVRGVRPAHGDFGAKGALVLKPGSPDQSMLYRRMTLTGLGRMPHVGSSVVDEKGARLIRDWIRGMGP
jgi:uncharacterized repeat protein (TIGR03806 family)